MSDDYESFPPAKRGPRPTLWASIVRELTEEDAAIVRARRPDPSISLTANVSRITHSHHRLAQLLAQGHDVTEVALLTGYQPSYIYSLRNNNPAFKELLFSYEQERRQVFVDVMERMKVLGLTTLDELQARLAEDPGGWSNRELMDMAEMLLVKPAANQRNLAVMTGGPASPTVNITFVDPGHSPPTIDATPNPIPQIKAAE